jgi:DMSO/TMAO reductase YedYZ heme-binding membrane subunit
MSPQLWWYVARATGIVAWLLAVGSVLAGLALASRMTGKRPGAPWLLDLHRHLGALTVLFTVAHGAALVADGYVEFDLADLTVPFASDWRPGPVAFGVVAAWLVIAVELTSLARRRIPPRLWRSVHVSSYLAAVAATAHYVSAGTDARNVVLRWTPTLAVATAVMFATYRVLVPRRRAQRPAVADLSR